MEDRFEKRLAIHYDELKWLYMELYDDEDAFRQFTGMLRLAYDEREETLRRRDRRREAEPGWYKGCDTLGMIIYADLFAGTLKGVQEKLGYVRDCGVDMIHLMPFLDSPLGKSDGGYAVSDFRKVRPDLGTMQDLKVLAQACHEQQIDLCADFVMNHTSEEHPWAKAARRGEKAFQDMYFMYDDWEMPDRFSRTMPEVFPTTAPGSFTWCDEAKKVVMTSFYPYQWDLNYANPAVLREMTESMLFLCNQGIDILRLDAVPYIWKTPGTTCRNLPQVHNLVRILHMVTDIVCPGVLLLGEVVMEPSKVVPYFGSIEKPECHMLYNVTTMCTTWHTVATKDVRLLGDQLAKVFALPKEYLFLNYLRCHDDIGWGLDYGFLRQLGQQEIPHKKFLNEYLTGRWPGSDARGELYNDSELLGDARLCGRTASLAGIEAAEYEGDEQKLEKGVRLHIMLHAFLLTQRGMPILYSGDEIGQLNDYSYHEDPLKREDSRYLHRGCMDWEQARMRRRETSVQGRIFQALKRLEKIRRDHPAFSNEADCSIAETGNDRVLGIQRSCGDARLLALFNFGDEEETVWISESGSAAGTGAPGGTDLLTGQPQPAGELRIEGCGFRWIASYF